MDSRKFVIKETLLIFSGQVVCCAVMVGVFALLGKFDSTVILGALFGGILSTLNFFFMAVAATIASDKAIAQDVKGGQATVQLSYYARLAVIAVILFALVKSGLCNVICAVLPLTFNRLILTVCEFFRKGDSL